MELNICLIGCGMIGKEHIERIQNRIRGAKVVAVCDVFEEGVKKGAELAGPGTKTYTPPGAGSSGSASDAGNPPAAQGSAAPSPRRSLRPAGTRTRRSARPAGRRWSASA